jgi:hypothetical protein
MDEGDRDYYRRRQQQELHAAEHAADICCRNIHLELARLYGLRLDEAVHAGASRRVVSVAAMRFAVIDQDFL